MKVFEALYFKIVPLDPSRPLGYYTSNDKHFNTLLVLFLHIFIHQVALICNSRGAFRVNP